MASYLIDTSILMRLANASDAQHVVTRLALAKLRRAGEEMRTAPQNLIEFRSAATRPVVDNGLGLSPHLVEQKIGLFEARFPILTETAAIYSQWKSLVEEFGVIGKQVHDARLVAVCRVYGVENVLTFNTRHFQRFAAGAPLAFNAITPSDL